MHVRVILYIFVVTLPLSLIYKAPSGYPSQLHIILQTMLLVTFQWKELACYEEKGPITGYQYRVYYNFNYYEEGIVDRSTTMITLPYNNMQGFSVAAINEAGIGVHCPPVEVPYFIQGNKSQYESLATTLIRQVLKCIDPFQYRYRAKLREWI